jgi:RNA polymerase sigma factor (TIGR02999 family)
MSEGADRVAELLQRWVSGDETALGALAPMVYRELRRLAHHHLRSERDAHTLQSTALVNEVYIRLMGGHPARVEDRGHFVAIASNLMRQILVEYARNRHALKRDGGRRISLDQVADLPVGGDGELVALDDALTELSRLDERQGRIVVMKFFGGLTAPEIAKVLGISLATVERDWATARIWLRRAMHRAATP